MARTRRMMRDSFRNCCIYAGRVLDDVSAQYQTTSMSSTAQLGGSRDVGDPPGAREPDEPFETSPEKHAAPNRGGALHIITALRLALALGAPRLAGAGPLALASWARRPACCRRAAAASVAALNLHHHFHCQFNPRHVPYHSSSSSATPFSRFPHSLAVQ
jgi:hypothetical protein